MSDLTVKLRELASRGSFNDGIQINTHELLELIDAVEEAELHDADVAELERTVATYRKSSSDHQKRISEIRSLPKYLFDRNYGIEKTPVGDYIRVEDIDELVSGGCEL